MDVTSLLKNDYHLGKKSAELITSGVSKESSDTVTPAKAGVQKV
jgi:hypothetical protein